MRAVIQRVANACLVIDQKVYSEIQNGFLVLLGVEEEDDDKDIEWLVQKVINMRIFGDAEGKMNLTLQDISGEIMVVSQFTLFASTKKGNRPSFIKAAKPAKAEELYLAFVEEIKKIFPNNVATGLFGADMKIGLLNDGPVTIIIDSKNRE